MTDLRSSPGCVKVTAVALALAVGLEVTGPPRSLLFSLRLPLLMVALGVIWAETRWRWGSQRRWDWERPRQPVSMATPSLTVSATAGVAAMTVKLVSVSPVLACVVLGAASACCCGVVFLLIGGGGKERSARPRKRGVLAGRVPGQAAGPVAVDA